MKLKYQPIKSHQPKKRFGVGWWIRHNLEHFTLGLFRLVCIYRFYLEAFFLAERPKSFGLTCLANNQELTGLTSIFTFWITFLEAYTQNVEFLCRTVFESDVDFKEGTSTNLLHAFLDVANVSIVFCILGPLYGHAKNSKHSGTFQVASEYCH